VFYKVCGKGVGGIDGFYFRSSFDVYKEMALINPDNPVELCDELYKQTCIPVVLMDANDLQRDQLGKSHGFPLTDEEIQEMVRKCSRNYTATCGALKVLQASDMEQIYKMARG
jgi:hypothetical protein